MNATDPDRRCTCGSTPTGTSTAPRYGPRWRRRSACWRRPDSSWHGVSVRRRNRARSRTRRCGRSSSSFRPVIGSGRENCGVAAHGARDSAGTVMVSVPCVAGVAFRLTRRAGTGTNPLLAMPRHDDLVGAIVAHEIGHLLGIRHAPSGLMRARLEAADLIALRRGTLRFSPAERAAANRSLVVQERIPKPEVCTWRPVSSASVWVGCIPARDNDARAASGQSTSRQSIGNQRTNP